MWNLILSFLGGPFVNALLSAYGKYLQSKNTTENIAANLAARELAVQQQENVSQAQYRIAELGYWYEPDKLMGYCVAIYLAKLLIWDKVLGLGTTDGLCKVGDSCWTGSVANLIVMFYFGKRGFENVAKIIQNIKR